MINPLSTIRPIPAISEIQPASKPDADNSFQSLFQQAVYHVDQTQSAANQKVEQFLNGEGGELHEVAMATQEAELTFEMFQQVKNKVVSAYQEVMRMQL